MVSPILLSVLLAVGGVEKPKMAVTALSAAGEVAPEIARSMTELVTAEVAARGYFDPISSAEIATLLGAERQRQLLGCNEEASACMAEMVGAMGARFVMSGTLAKIGGVFQLNLQVLDTKTAKPVGRSSKLAKDFEALRMQVPYAVAEAGGTPLPPPPSKVLPYAMIGTGAAAVVAGGVLGIMGLNNESVARGELAADDANATVILRPAQSYRDQLARASVQKSAALISMIAGAALVGAGIWLIPPDAPQPGQRVGLTVVPAGNGVAFVGVFP